MYIMKKIFFLSLLLLSDILLTSCIMTNNKPETTFQTQEQTVQSENPNDEESALIEWVNQGHNIIAYYYCRDYPNGNPDPEYPSYLPQTGIKVSSDNFIFKTEYEQYKSDTDIIVCSLEKTDGSAIYYYYYLIPYVETLENGEWKRLVHAPYILGTGSGWPLGGSAGYSTVNLEIDVSEVFPSMSAGKYRAVAFVGDECTPLYAEFEVVD